MHYTWQHKLFPLQELLTTDGQPVEVIDPGLRNTDAGADFFNAKVKIGGTLWVGNVEIHERASQWYAHGHHEDKAYDNVILHVVETDDRQVSRRDGVPLPTLLLPVSPAVRENYEALMRAANYPPCASVIPHLPRLMVHSYLSALHTERLGQKAALIEERRGRRSLNWEDAFFTTLARNFGFGVNGDAFEAWTECIPLRAVDKHRDDLFQIEALFFGQAGLLEEEEGDDYYRRLRREYRYLAHKFEMSGMDNSRWRFLRMRPMNFPHVRIAQLAWLYYKGVGLLSRLLEAETVEQIYGLLVTDTSEYWKTHYTFGNDSPLRTKRLSRSTQDLLIINTVSPFLYAYGRYKGEERLCHRAVALLEKLKAENNRIIRTWAQCGLEVNNAADSQALIQLKRLYCDTRKCLQCRIGYEYLKRTARGTFPPPDTPAKEGMLGMCKLKKENEK